MPVCGFAFIEERHISFHCLKLVILYLILTLKGFVNRHNCFCESLLDIGFMVMGLLVLEVWCGDYYPNENEP